MNEDRIDRLGCEYNVRQRIGQQFGVQLEKRTLVVGTTADGSPKVHQFDGVSPDCQIVMECKTNQLKVSVGKAKGRYDSALKQVVFTDLYLLGRVTAKTKLMVLTDRALFEMCSQDMDGLLAPDTQIVHCSLT